MLSENQVVAQRRAIESTYTGLCTITESKKVKNANGSTGFEEVEIYTDEPCRLSYKSASAVKSSEMINNTSQVIKLFIAPEIAIKSNSKIVVTQNGVTRSYKNSSETIIYPTHQEIELVLEKEES